VVSCCTSFYADFELELDAACACQMHTMRLAAKTRREHWSGGTDFLPCAFPTAWRSEPSYLASAWLHSSGVGVDGSGVLRAPAGLTEAARRSAIAADRKAVQPQSRETWKGALSERTNKMTSFESDLQWTYTLA